MVVMAVSVLSYECLMGYDERYIKCYLSQIVPLIKK